MNIYSHGNSIDGSDQVRFFKRSEKKIVIINKYQRRGLSVIHIEVLWSQTEVRFLLKTSVNN